jgi:hypothetical protein
MIVGLYILGSYLLALCKCYCSHHAKVIIDYTFNWNGALVLFRLLNTIISNIYEIVDVRNKQYFNFRILVFISQRFQSSLHIHGGDQHALMTYPFEKS